jgi:hypothetical protein
LKNSYIAPDIYPADEIQKAIDQLSVNNDIIRDQILDIKDCLSTQDSEILADLQDVKDQISEVKDSCFSVCEESDCSLTDIVKDVETINSSIEEIKSDLIETYDELSILIEKEKVTRETDCCLSDIVKDIESISSTVAEINSNLSDVYEELSSLVRKEKTIREWQYTKLEKSYKVYTALLTQSGGDDFQEFVGSGTLTVGVTYLISDNATNPDFTNVGAPNNDVGTYFVATGTTPNSWGEATLGYNTGAPVVTVLENTIGNIWWTYNGVAQYEANSNSLFTIDKTILFIQGSNDGDTSAVGSLNNLYWIDSNSINCITSGEGNLTRTSIEIRVY